MDDRTKSEINVSAELACELFKAIDRLNELLGQAADVGLDVLIQKEEKGGQRATKTSLSLRKATYRVEFAHETIKPG